VRLDEVAKNADVSPHQVITAFGAALRRVLLPALR
jgi:hypothetical protein